MKDILATILTIFGATLLSIAAEHALPASVVVPAICGLVLVCVGCLVEGERLGEGVEARHERERRKRTLERQHPGLAAYEGLSPIEAMTMRMMVEGVTAEEAAEWFLTTRGEVVSASVRPRPNTLLDPIWLPDPPWLSPLSVWKNYLHGGSLRRVTLRSESKAAVRFAAREEPSNGS